MIIKITAIIYSRLNSKRLYKKALIKIGNKSLIEHVIDRVKKIQNIDKIILATSKSKIDDSLVNVAKKNKIFVYRGSERNVLQRTYGCISKNKTNLFLRVCGDRVFFDNEFIDKLCKKIKKKPRLFSKYDLISNNYGRKKTDKGLTVEFMSKECVKKIIFQKNINFNHKEHITSYVYQNLSKFKINKIISPNYHFKKLKYTIDEEEDILRSNTILEKLKKRDLFNFRKIYLTNKKI